MDHIVNHCLLRSYQGHSLDFIQSEMQVLNGYDMHIFDIETATILCTLHSYAEHILLGGNFMYNFRIILN